MFFEHMKRTGLIAALLVSPLAATISSAAPVDDGPSAEFAMSTQINNLAQVIYFSISDGAKDFVLPIMIRDEPVGHYSIYTPLAVPRKLSVEELDRFFENKGHPSLSKYSQVFLDASYAYGLDPHYVVAHFALETGWGTSKIWRTKHNGFGIGACDGHTSLALHFESPEDGIMEGVAWIAVNFLKNPQSSTYAIDLHGMNKCYATSNSWDDKIASIMNDLNEDHSP